MAPLSFRVKEPWFLGNGDDAPNREGEVSYWQHLVAKALRWHTRCHFPVVTVHGSPLRTFLEMVRVAEDLAGPRTIDAMTTPANIDALARAWSSAYSWTPDAFLIHNNMFEAPVNVKLLERDAI